VQLPFALPSSQVYKVVTDLEKQMAAGLLMDAGEPKAIK
jgi:hypothetical protein